MHSPIARPEVLALRTSEIRTVANAGMARGDILAFWFGESDQPTPAFIREAAAQALLDGKTFYTHNLGRPDLREALSSYLTRLHGVPIGTERLAITNAGVNALMIASQAVVSPGDRVVVVAPVWPNVAEIPRILSARVETVSLTAAQGRWRLDLDKLMDALTPDTRALFLNSPNNPTGWTLPAEDRAAVLARCREHGIWLIADDVYERLSFGPEGKAPSFLPLIEPTDRVISTNSFSKAWRMTGWRLGWMVVPPELLAPIEKLAQNLYICPSTLAQRAALACFEPDAIAQYEQRRAEFRRRRDFIVAALRAIGLPVPVEPDGAFYVWFDCSAYSPDSWDFCFEMLHRAHVALTPGRDFGPAQAQRFVRLSFACSMAQLQVAADRLARELQAWPLVAQPVQAPVSAAKPRLMQR